MSGMIKQKGPNDAEKLSLDIVNEVQGRQFDIMTLNLLVNEYLDFLKEKERLKVALTHACGEFGSGV